MRQTMEAAQNAAPCDSRAGVLSCGIVGRLPLMLLATGGDLRPFASQTMTYSSTQAEFAATLAGIRTSLYDLAMVHDKAERTVLMKAAAALALFESDTLRKAAGPLLPGETF
jgi:hypothetical protein